MILKTQAKEWLSQQKYNSEDYKEKIEIFNKGLKDFPDKVLRDLMYNGEGGQ